MSEDGSRLASIILPSATTKANFLLISSAVKRSNLQQSFKSQKKPISVDTTCTHFFYEAALQITMYNSDH